MCKRYSFTCSKEKVKREFGITSSIDLRESYNIAPTQLAYVIANHQPLELSEFFWGLIPYTSNDPTIGEKLINARADQVASSSSFRMPFRKRRCLVPADGYYFWKQQGTMRQAYRVTSAEANKMFVFAGIWDEWTSDSGKSIKTFSIITVPNNQQLEGHDDEMPLILDSADTRYAWLDEETTIEGAVAIISAPPYAADLHIYKVTNKLEKATYDQPDLLKEIADGPNLFDS